MTPSEAATSKARSTAGAELLLESPPCVARTVTVPAPVMVRVLPLIDAGPETTAKATGRPAEEVALRSKGASPKVQFAGALKVIVWSAFVTASVPSAKEKA